MGVVGASTINIVCRLNNDLYFTFLTLPNRVHANQVTPLASGVGLGTSSNWWCWLNGHSIYAVVSALTISTYAPALLRYGSRSPEIWISPYRASQDHWGDIVHWVVFGPVRGPGQHVVLNWGPLDAHLVLQLPGFGVQPNSSHSDAHLGESRQQV